MNRILIAIGLLAIAAPPANAYTDLVAKTGTYTTTTITASGSITDVTVTPWDVQTYTQPAEPGAPSYSPNQGTDVSGRRQHCGFVVIDETRYIGIPTKRSSCTDVANVVAKQKHKTPHGEGWKKKTWTCNPKSSDIKCRSGKSTLLLREVDDDDYDKAKTFSREGLIDCGWYRSYRVSTNPFATDRATCGSVETIAEIVRVTYQSSQTTGGSSYSISPTRVGLFTPPTGCTTLYSGYLLDGGYVVSCDINGKCLVVRNGPMGPYKMVMGDDLRGYYRRMLDPSPC